MTIPKEPFLVLNNTTDKTYELYTVYFDPDKSRLAGPPPVETAKPGDTLVMFVAEPGVVYGVRCSDE